MNPAGIDALTVPSLVAAIDAALVRQQVIAANIAHAGTPGRRPLQVTFEQALSSAGPALQPVIRPAGGSSAVDGAVRLDAEAVAMTRNALHHQALLRALDRHLALMSLAVADGRR